ncbi:MAG: hypothetical protein GTN62_13070 [Gemmatimonadales bacterium]|nr:hypothetical protein [Gemmatimonadales bacterium]NIN12841.1 hypothetical protein [Gemmatimonadales bacterium]NIN51019.1 hypothetical protein [Gemmatimonadales bacterium]NIP08483.1 hypothetical protein [Gemmatimonadales bacterium]NIR02523.1 hypothetical protein [Gemmatimonadales bacterium]
MSEPPAPPVHAVIPLAVLESMRSLDVPAPDQLDEYHREFATKRLGMSRTVAVQIERYRRLAARNTRVAAADVVALLQLAGRRNDAALVFADAGRRAARHATRRVAAVARWLWRAMPRFARNRWGFALARRAVKGAFDLELAREGAQVVAVGENPPSAQASTDGSACALYGCAVAEVLRTFTDFDGAVLHGSCRARGELKCRWHTATATED